MSLITWTKETFGTGVAQHDNEHITLFQMLNELHDSIGGDRAATGQKLDALIDFVVKHFKAEETNMQNLGYPDYAAHKALHDALVETCAGVQAKFHAGEAEVTADVTGLVKDWLYQHIPNVDMKYGPFMNSKGIN